MTPPRAPLAELLGNFTYVEQEIAATHESKRGGESITKRRRIEPADAATVSLIARKNSMTTAARDTPVAGTKKRLKAPKKAQTITALATAAYQPASEAQDESLEVVSHFFAEQTNGTRSEERNAINETVSKPKKARKPRTKKTDDGRAASTDKKQTKAKKAKVTFSEQNRRPSLHSPGRASKQMQQQAFLFGTSSQLAKPESPTLTRATTLRESEAIPSLMAVINHPRKSCSKVPTAPHGTSLSIEQADRELWCSAARNLEGSVLKEGSSASQLRERYNEINECRNSQAIGGGVPMGEKAVIDLCSSPPLPSSPARSPESKQKISDRANAVLSSDKWHDIDQIDDPNHPTTPSPPRRRKSASPSLALPLHLEQSEPMPLQHDVPSAILALAVGASLKHTDPQWRSIQEDLFPRITETVKSSASSADPSIPSWYEKILLYDPIDIEDLTDWLSSHGLRIQVRRSKPKERSTKRTKSTKAGLPEDDYEVKEEPLKGWMVQKWCEEKSICCLWKEGSYGSARARY